jgi:hypothetical protein
MQCLEAGNKRGGGIQSSPSKAPEFGALWCSGWDDGTRNRLSQPLQGLQRSAVVGGRVSGGRDNRQPCLAVLALSYAVRHLDMSRSS